MLLFSIKTSISFMFISFIDSMDDTMPKAGS